MGIDSEKNNGLKTSPPVSESLILFKTLIRVLHEKQAEYFRQRVNIKRNVSVLI